jgi:hypothetical protein
MNRRNFIKVMGLGISSLVSTGCSRALKSSQSDLSVKKPNIIFIMADDKFLSFKDG